MEKLLNDQLLDLNGLNFTEQHSNVLVAEKELAIDKQSEIENGNLQDYLEIFGGDGNI